MPRRLFLALLACSLQAPLRAASSGADFLLLEPGARAAASGGAWAGQGASLEALRYNPAGLRGLQGAEASLAHASAAGDWSNEWIGLAWAPSGGGIVLGAELLVSSIRPFDLYDAQGRSFDSAQAGSQNLALAAAVPLGFHWLSLGAEGRLFRSQLYKFASQGYGLDLGLLASGPHWPLSLGFAVQNIGQQSAYISAADPLPLSLRAGLSGAWSLDEHLTLRPRADLLAFADESRPLEWRGGLEAVVLERLSLRGGLQRVSGEQQFSFGLGLAWGAWSVDYAYLPGNELGSSHLIQLQVVSGP